jgi:long-chain acyl-CoA synthetase
VPRQTILEYLENFYRHDSQPAYVQQRGYRIDRWSYRRIADTSAQFARELERRGIAKGDRVIIWGENCAEWVVCFFGCALRGAVAVPMDQIAAAEFTRKVAGQVDARLLVCSARHSGLGADLPELILDSLAGTLSSHSRERYSPARLGLDDTVEIVFTSGTTADPKGVVISHRNILANLGPLETEIQKYLKYERLFHPIRFLNLLPLSHVFGQFLGIFIPQLIAGTVIFNPTLNPSEIIHTVKRERISVIVTVPRLLETLRDKVERDAESRSELEQFRMDFAAAEKEHFLKRWWRFRRIHRQFGWKFWAFISGGATLNAEVEIFWTRLGFVVIQGYGLTETTSLISVNHPFKLGKGSIGQVLPGRDVKLDENGEILVRGENIAAGYWQDRELKPVTEDHGWFRTGDIGEIDSAGNLYFKGRKKNVIVNAEGMNIYPEDLEAALRAQPEIRDCVVAGLQQDGNAEPCAVLLLRNREADAGNAVRRANKNLAEYQHMRRWLVWPEEDFPRTSTQKIRLDLVQQRVEATFGGGTVSESRGGTLADLIGRITGKPAAQISSQTNLSTDLSLSSIDRVELLSAIEDRYQIDVNENQFTAATTLEDLEKMVRQPALQRAGYDYPRWPQSWPARWIRLAVYYSLAWPATMVLARPRIRGRENLRDTRTPVLIVANHISTVDIGYVMAALPGRFRTRLAVAMEGEMLRAMRHPPPEISFFRRKIEQLSYFLIVALFNVFPLPKQSGFRRSFSFTGELVDRRFSVVIFPEGVRTQTGQMAPFQSGIGLLANNLKIPLVPIRIDGLFELKRRRQKIAVPGKVKVTIGAAQCFPPDTEPEQIAQTLQRQVEGMEWK